jgi:Chondroitin N-acetylgalactosaminyltransferase
LQICILGRQATALVLVLFPSDEVTDTVALVRSIQKRHPSAAISILPVFVPFARGMALQLGAAHVMVTFKTNKLNYLQNQTAKNKTF